MSRVMIDCIHANVDAVRQLFPDAAVVAGYDTGSPDIRWDNHDWSSWPQAVKVHIDQGAEGSPVAAATVRDVEAGAWTPAAAIETEPWTAPRPTIYCDRAMLHEVVVDLGWAGAVWLAWPGWAGQREDPVFPAVKVAFDRGQVVAVQDEFHAVYDRSVVLDDRWPFVQPVPTWQEDAMKALPTLAIGAVGKDVYTVQGLCGARGQSLVLDGVFGPKTDQAVRVLQSRAGVPVDGIVGPLTWPVLMGVA